MFWSTEKILERQNIHPLVDPFDSNHVNQGAYELCLGPEVLVTGQPSATKLRLNSGDAVSIPPGQLAVLLTEETVSLPADAVGLISMRTRVKLGGLINVSGFHVDPGFNGRLKFSVYNAGSSHRVLQRGESIFMLWFCDLDRSTADLYRGSRQGQDAISGDEQTLLQGHIASPGQLQKEIDKVNTSIVNITHRLDLLQNIGLGVLVALIVIIVTSLLSPYLPKPSTSATPVPTQTATVTTTPVAGSTTNLVAP
jgi:dCTP deaminase